MDFRVRLTQDDSHVFCRKSQIEDEIKNLIKIVRELYMAVGDGEAKSKEGFLIVLMRINTLAI